jgi:hypothetical protein
MFPKRGQFTGPRTAHLLVAASHLQLTYLAPKTLMEHVIETTCHTGGTTVGALFCTGMFRKPLLKT